MSLRSARTSAPEIKAKSVDANAEAEPVEEWWAAVAEEVELSVAESAGAGAAAVAAAAEADALRFLIAAALGGDVIAFVADFVRVADADPPADDGSGRRIVRRGAPSSGEAPAMARRAAAANDAAEGRGEADEGEGEGGAGGKGDRRPA